VAERNKHRGSSLDSFLREQRLFDHVQTAALKRAISEAVAEGMAATGLSKVEMARRMRTSRSQIDRVLDPKCTTVQLDSLVKAASAVGRELRISLKKVVPSWRNSQNGSRGEPK
jgi:predicted XRE-type DNA-binding protein